MNCYPRLHLWSTLTGISNVLEIWIKSCLRELSTDDSDTLHDTISLYGPNHTLITPEVLILFKGGAEVDVEVDVDID